MAQPYRVKVYDSVIASLFSPGQPVWNEGVKITEEMRQQARRDSPKRSGVLYGSHYKNLLRSGRYGIRGYVGNAAPHALWVHEGTGKDTGGRIYPAVAEAMIVPKRRNIPRYVSGTKPNWNTHFPAYSVRGQDANPWLLVASEKVLARYR